MSFRGRLVGAVSAVTIVTLGGAFTAVSVTVNASQQRQLDDALRAVAALELREAAAVRGEDLTISDRPGPAANDVGPLTKYGVIYAPDGHVVTSTPTLRGAPPARASLPATDGEGFDLWYGGEHIRGLLLPIPGHDGDRLLMAAPRTDLDGDAAFLLRAMLLVFVVAVVWAAAVATWIVRRLTREHEAITAVARAVVAGDLTARVSVRGGDPETAQLARDIDDMIERLSLLVTSQRRFIAHAAHELRSPLTALYGELSHALRRSRDAESYRAAIEEALDATRRLRLISDDLLALARIGADTGEPDEPCDLAASVRAAAEAVAWEARERGVRVETGEIRAVVAGRPRDLERLMRNLIENAVRHSPEGGAVEVSADAREEGWIEAAVRDEGPGVPEEDRERVFESFYRGARERAASASGSGLGLAIAREIARAHGGEVSLAAEGTSLGARFVVRLPSSGAPGEP